MRPLLTAAVLLALPSAARANSADPQTAPARFFLLVGFAAAVLTTALAAAVVRYGTRRLRLAEPLPHRARSAAVAALAVLVLLPAAAGWTLLAWDAGHPRDLAYVGEDGRVETVQTSVEWRVVAACALPVVPALMACAVCARLLARLARERGQPADAR